MRMRRKCSTFVKMHFFKTFLPQIIFNGTWIFCYFIFYDIKFGNIQGKFLFIIYFPYFFLITIHEYILNHLCIGMNKGLFYYI